ncbi:MAG: hypothetical protein U1F43_13390 [Myxococcota bacterium]
MGEPDTPVAVVDAPLRTSVVPEKELFVTDLSVVNDAKHEQYAPGKWNTDPNGSWSFGRLIDNLTGLAHPTDRQRSDFVLHWLRTARDGPGRQRPAPGRAAARARPRHHAVEAGQHSAACRAPPRPPAAPTRRATRPAACRSTATSPPSI